MVEEQAKERKSIGIEFASWLGAFCLLTFILPLILISLLPPGSRAGGLATLAASPALEYLAISVGIGLGVDPVISFFLTVLPCTGICCLVIGLIGALGDSSARAKRFLEKVKKKLDKYPRFKKFGVASSSVFVIFFGIYIASGVVVFLGFKRVHAIILMFGGICLITFILGLATLGIIDLFQV